MHLTRSKKANIAADKPHVSSLLQANVAVGLNDPLIGLGTVPESKYLSDEDVWSAFQNGEDAAFNMLYARYSDRLYGYLRFLLVGSPRHLDDVFQETWVTVFKSRGEESAIQLSTFSGWLFRVAHNAAISHLRRDAKTIGIDDLDVDSELIEGFTVEAAQDAYDAPNSEEIMRHVTQAVEELPLLLREVFVLSEFERLTLDQIGEMLGISRTNAKVRLFRARRMIRERVAKILDLG